MLKLRNEANFTNLIKQRRFIPCGGLMQVVNFAKSWLRCRSAAAWYPGLRIATRVSIFLGRRVGRVSPDRRLRAGIEDTFATRDLRVNEAARLCMRGQTFRSAWMGDVDKSGRQESLPPRFPRVLESWERNPQESFIKGRGRSEFGNPNECAPNNFPRLEPSVCHWFGTTSRRWRSPEHSGRVRPVEREARKVNREVIRVPYLIPSLSLTRLYGPTDIEDRELKIQKDGRIHPWQHRHKNQRPVKGLALGFLGGLVSGAQSTV